MKPRIFIACSREALDVADALQENMARDAEVTVWDQDVFQPSSYTLEDLVKVLDRVDSGVFIFSPEDTVKLRDVTYAAVRDNVLFELGLFIGRLGRERNFIIKPTGVEEFRLPTDLMGLGLLEFDAQRQDGNLNAALNPACRKILKRLAPLPPNRGREIPVAPEPDAGAVPLQIKVPDQILLCHFMGSLHAVVFVDFFNPGRDVVNISRIRCVLRGPTGVIYDFPARTILSRQPPQPGQMAIEYPLIRVVLKANENWGESIRFYGRWIGDQQEQIDRISIQVRDNISGKQPPNPGGGLIEADKEIVDEALSLFERNFTLTQGEYQGFLVVEGDRLLGVKGFVLTLPGSSIETMKLGTARAYKYGFGICFPNNDPMCNLWPAIRVLGDEEARAAYQELMKGSTASP
jgi:hypothetical protein